MGSDCLQVKPRGVCALGLVPRNEMTSKQYAVAIKAPKVSCLVYGAPVIGMPT